MIGAVKTFVNKLLKSNFHFIWLILFFVLHNYNEFKGDLSFRDLSVFFLTTVSAGIAFYYIHFFFSTNRQKAGIFTTVLIAVFMLFGAFQDLLSSFKATAFLSSLPVLLIITVSLLFLIFILLFFFQKHIPVIIKYLNMLFILYFFIEVIQLMSVSKADVFGKEAMLNEYENCTTCNKPSIYLVILDEYAGSNTLKNRFHFDNSAFYQALESRGFYVTGSSISNYKLTVLSIASMLNMDYVG